MRLFVAIELDERVKAALVKAQRRLGDFDSLVRWVGRGQMHLTLKFLGEVAEANVAEVARGVEDAVARGSSGEFATGRVGCFPPTGRVRVLWMGLGASSDWLTNAQRRIEEVLAGLGFSTETRSFAPHLTLGRVRQDTSNGKLRASGGAVELAPVTQAVDRIVLMESQLTPRGARYAPVGSWRLGSKGGSP